MLLRRLPSLAKALIPARFASLRTGLLASLLSGLALLPAPLAAMEFTRIQPVELAGSGMRPDHMILGEGPILPGDAEAFEAFMAGLPPTNHYEAVQWGIALNSPGGSLMEGIRLGEAFRKHVVTTVVLNGQSCESACAVAYLGGAAMYAVAVAAERLLQPGARLGYHGIAVDSEATAGVNESLELARTTNALLRDYAIRMGVGDEGLVQSLFNTPPDKMEYIDTAREVLGLKLTLAVDDLAPPDGWAVNLCRHKVAGILDDLRLMEGYGSRVFDRPVRIVDAEAFRQRLLAAKYGEGEILGAMLYNALLSAPADIAADLIAGAPLWLDAAKLDAWEVDLARGAGFYYDSCFAVANNSSLTTVLVDSVAGTTDVESFSMLHGFPPDLALW